VLMGLLAVEGSAAALPNNGKTLTASFFTLDKQGEISFSNLKLGYLLSGDMYTLVSYLKNNSVGY